MALFDKRPDGVLLTKLPGFRKVFPFVMPTRTESTIGFPYLLRVKKMLALLEKLNEGRTTHRYTPFHVVLAASVRIIAHRPEVNRFVMGRRIYQRKRIVFSFVTKKELTLDAPEVNVTVEFDRMDTIQIVAEKIWAAVDRAKKSKKTSDEALSETITKLPRSLTRAAMTGWKVLDYFNLLPASALNSDPLYVTAYFANLGSIGLDAVDHHLFEWGTCSFFVVMGKIKKGTVAGENGEPVVEDVATSTYTLDERITDGVNFAKVIGKLTALIEDPEVLLEPPAGPLPDPFALA